jgi:eukaryotic-like serine/threonine-protein kinase
MTSRDYRLPERFAQPSELGRGAMGVVYRALDTQTQSLVAVKCLLHEATTEETRRRVEREVAGLARLAHPHVVRLLDTVSVEGCTLIVLELAADGSLGTVAATQPGLARLLTILRDIALGLEHIHAHGLVHRDIKPDNILFAGTVPKISDLGLSRAVDASSMLTAAGAVLGTFRYLSPEQIRSSAVDARADLYSLGVCMYEVLAGQPPFTGPSLMGLLQAHLTKQPPSLQACCPQLPEELSALVHQLLHKQPEARPQSAAAVAEALDALLASGLPAR